MTQNGQGLSDDDIVDMAKRNGLFSVTLRYRDQRLRARCRALRREGRLRGGHKIMKGRYIFYAA